MSKTMILLLALLAVIGLAATRQEPEIRRYLKMRSM